MLDIVIKNFPLQVCIFVQGAHHPPLHPEQPGVAGEKPREIWQEASQIWLRCVSISVHKKANKIYLHVCSYTEPEVARRLLSQGHVLVGHARVAVKEMDGQPALFNN